MKETYRGKLAFVGNCEDDQLLSIDGRHPLAERIEEDMDKHGRFLSVRYMTSETEVPEEHVDAAIVEHVIGRGSARYKMVYSEVTGYLWTDEEFRVGGHDMIRELTSAIGRFLHMEIEYNRANAALPQQQ